MPKLSILIPSFNDIRILRAIEALKGRNIQEVQIVVQDAGSAEEFIKTLKEKINYSDKLIIEPDNGIFDGINKGILNCDGDYILTIGSDDICPIDTVNSFLSLSSLYDLYFCNVKMFNNDGKIKRFWGVKPFSRNLYRLGVQYPHFGMIIKKELYLKYGLFNAKNKINADYEFFDNLTKKSNLKVYNDNKSSIFMQLGGTSTESKMKILLHQRLIFSYILRQSPDLIFAPFLKWIFKVNELFTGFVRREKIKV